MLFFNNLWPGTINLVTMALVWNTVHNEQNQNMYFYCIAFFVEICIADGLFVVFYLPVPKPDSEFHLENNFFGGGKAYVL